MLTTIKTKVIIFLLISTIVFSATSLDLINRKLKQGKLSEHEAVLLKVKALKAPKKIPQRFRGGTPIKCGTPVMLKVKRNWENYPDSVRKILNDYMRPPRLPETYVSPDGRFKLHYTTTGPDAADLSFVHRFARYFDEMWEFETDSLGYYTPPNDGTHGGDTLYDVYLHNLGAYGMTTVWEDGPRSWNDKSSYIEVENDYEGFPDNDDPEGRVIGAQKVTAAHEFFHAVQFAYDAGESRWWMEVSSTWMEEAAYPVVNDYLGYLETFFNQPFRSLTAIDGSHEYGSCIFNHYLQDVYGIEMIKSIWQKCRYNPSLQAIDSTLSEEGSSFKDAYAQFSCRNYFTGSRGDTSFYPDVSDYPEVSFMREHHPFPADTISIDNGPQPLGANFVSLDSSREVDSVIIHFDGRNDVPWVCGIIKYSSASDYEIDFMSIGRASGEGSYRIGSFPDWSRVVIIPVVGNYSRWIRPSYTYSVRSTFTSFPSPGELRVHSSTDTSVSLTWNPPSSSDSYSHFSVHRRLLGGTFTRLDSTSGNSYTDFRATMDTTYEYAVSAVYDEEASALSNVVSVTPQPVSVVDTVLLSRDFRAASSYADFWEAGDISAIRIQSSDTMYNYRLNKVYFLLYNFPGVASQDVRIKALEVTPSLAPGAEIASSERITITSFHEDTAVVDVSDMNIVIPSSKGIYLGVEYAEGDSGTVPSVVIDNSMRIGENVSYYYKDGWEEHYDFWADGGTMGYNMIWASFERLTSGVTDRMYTSEQSSFNIQSVSPNPFSRSCEIKFSVADRQEVEANIFDINGKLVKDLVNYEYKRGIYSLTWDGKDNSGKQLPSGLYFITLDGNSGMETRKVLLTR